MQKHRHRSKEVLPSEVGVCGGVNERHTVTEYQWTVWVGNTSAHGFRHVRVCGDTDFPFHCEHIGRRQYMRHFTQVEIILDSCRNVFDVDVRLVLYYFRED